MLMHGKKRSKLQANLFLGTKSANHLVSMYVKSRDIQISKVMRMSANMMLNKFFQIPIKYLSHPIYVPLYYLGKLAMELSLKG